MEFPPFLLKDNFKYVVMLRLFLALDRSSLKIDISSNMNTLDMCKTPTRKLQ